MKKSTQFLSKESLHRKRLQRQRFLPDATVVKKSESFPAMGVLLISTFPPRECGIATYSQDLMSSLDRIYGQSLKLSVCPLECMNDNHNYVIPIKYSLCSDSDSSYESVARQINLDPEVDVVILQHEFGLFRNNEEAFLSFLRRVDKPVILAFHTVIPAPEEALRDHVNQIAAAAKAITVMTRSSKSLLVDDYGIKADMITVIAHGTHLLVHANREELKAKYGFRGRKVLSTFGLLGPGKSIETTLDSLPEVVAKHPETIFLILGKTHPVLQKHEGERYRQMLEEKIKVLGLEKHARFINRFLPLEELLEYLQLSDVYLFTSKDPNQAVSGTFSYALGCGCPIISTPIPHAREVLGNNNGWFINFNDSRQLAEVMIRFLDDPVLRQQRSYNGLHSTTATSWENSALAHGLLLESIHSKGGRLTFQKPPINLDHLKRMTTDHGILQFAILNQPDPTSGYTLDDNARALMVCCRYFDQFRDHAILSYIEIYFNFIASCQTLDGTFSNYVDINKKFTLQNEEVNLEDSNGRAIWALGNFLYLNQSLPAELNGLKHKAIQMICDFLPNVKGVESPRSLAFIIKGLYYFELTMPSVKLTDLISLLARKLVSMYDQVSTKGWRWYETYLTYANSVLPDALICAYLVTGEESFKERAKTSFDFLWSKLFRESHLQVISNRNWLLKESSEVCEIGGEQPIDVAYTILALEKFDTVFPGTGYDRKKVDAFNWFLGKNRLRQVVYNPKTGGCYDGLEEKNVNLNQGAESTLSYLLSRLLFPEFDEGSEAHLETTHHKKTHLNSR